MLMNLIVAAGVLLIAYMWTAQGFFSALIHLLCTLAAGAVAFAVWEPLTYGLLLGVAPTIAWSVGLVVPFVVTLVVLRVLTDKLITQDPKLPGAIDFVGGGLAGASSGVISMGVLVIGVGFMPLGVEFMGHRKVNYDATGNLVQTSALWVPADTLTARLYERLSLTAFTPGDSALAIRMPGVEDQASLLRASYDDRGSTILTPDAFDLVAAYTVEAPSLDELTSDGFNVAADGSPITPEIKRVDGDAPATSSVIRGYTVQFLDGSAEKSGQVIVGAGQARLICKLADGSSEGFQPVAVVAQSRGKDPVASRYLFNAKDVFIGSAGSARNPTMSFEFVVPADAEPLDLLLKQVRIDLSEAPAERTFTVDERDDAVFSLDLIGRSDEGPTGARPDPSTIARSSGGGADSAPIDGRDARDLGVRVSRDLGSLTLSRQKKGSLTINDDSRVVSGTHVFAGDDIKGVKVPNALRVKEFHVRPGLSLIKADVSINKRLSLLGRAVSAAEQLLPPVLTDSNGQIYEAIGFIFDGGDRVEIRYEPGQPIRAMSELPTLSSSRPSDTLTLLFQVTQGVEIVSFTLGQQVEIATFDPPLIPTR